MIPEKAEYRWGCTEGGRNHVAANCCLEVQQQAASSHAGLRQYLDVVFVYFLGEVIHVHLPIEGKRRRALD